MSLYSLILFLAFIFNLFIGIFVYVKNRKSAVNKSFFLLVLILSVWLLGCLGESITTNKNIALLWDKLLYVGVILYPISFLNFLFEVIGKKKNIKFFIFLFVISFIYIIFNFLPSLRRFFIKDVEKRFSFRFIAVPNFLWFVLVIIGMSICIYGLYLIFTHLLKSKSRKRLELSYLFLAYIVLTFGGGLYFLLPLNIKIPSIDAVMVVIFSSIVSYAILKYHLLDIKIAITRAGIFLFVYFFVLGVPFWLGYTTKAWLPSTTVAVLLATFGPFIYQYLRRQAEDILLKEQRRYHRALMELSKSLSRIHDLEKLTKTIVITIVEEVSISFAGIYLMDEEYRSYKLNHCYPEGSKSRFCEFIPLDFSLIKALYTERRPLLSEELPFQDKIRLDTGLVAPCFIGDELSGFLVVGSKSNNHMYNQDDLIIFETISYSISLAIENTKFFREIEEHQRKARIQEMDLFSYSLAHEIDNPMSAIKTTASYLRDYLLKEINLPKEKREELELGLSSILKSQERVSGMVKAIEEFGKPTKGRFNLLKLEDVIDSYLKLYLAIFKNHGIYFTKELPKEIPFIRGIKQELMEVIANLSDNAIHATLGTPQGQQKHIHLKVEIPNPDFIRISLSDNGYGIPQEKLRSIFAPFVTTKASTEGKGMGLYIVRRIVEKHKGRVWAESEGKDRGATFYIELPIAKDVRLEEVEKEKSSTIVFIKPSQKEK